MSESPPLLFHGEGDLGGEVVLNFIPRLRPLHSRFTGNACSFSYIQRAFPTNFQAAAVLMIETSRTQNPNLKFRKTIARTYLRADRLKDAVEIFLGILQDAPDDVDTLLDLGNLYLASGSGKTAARLFRRVLELAPERTIIKKQLDLATNEEDSDLPEEPVSTDSEAIARLLQRLTGESEPILEREVVNAYEMLQKILTSPCPGDEVANSLDEIGKLLPALIELNIRQARADGKAAVAEALQNVQMNIAL